MRHLKRWLIVLAAILLFLLGLASVWTPVPIGAVLMTVATVLLITHSRSGRAFVRRVRKRFSFVDGRMVWFEDRSNLGMVRVLRTTRPLESRLQIKDQFEKPTHLVSETAGVRPISDTEAL